MKFTMNCRALFPTQTQWLHPWSRRLFLVMGTFLLSYCRFVLLDTRFNQAYLKETFQQALKNSRLLREALRCIPPLLRERIIGGWLAVAALTAEALRWAT